MMIKFLANFSCSGANRKQFLPVAYWWEGWVLVKDIQLLFYFPDNLARMGGFLVEKENNGRMDCS